MNLEKLDNKEYSIKYNIVMEFMNTGNLEKEGLLERAMLLKYNGAFLLKNYREVDQLLSHDGWLSDQEIRVDFLQKISMSV